MGHKQRKSPRRGSLQFWHRQRAKREYPRIRNWAQKKTPSLLGFSAYKAGMTHIIAVDNHPRSPTKGEEIRIPVTILEAPNLKVAAIRFYTQDAYGIHAFSDIFSDDLDPVLSRRTYLPKKKQANQKLQELETKLNDFVDVRVMAYTQPSKTTIGKKAPELMEFAIGGEDVKSKLDYAKSILGKEVSASSVFKDGEIVDTHAVTKGKGFQGVIKRFGVKLRPHKSEKGVRVIGNLGPRSPTHAFWWTAQAGRMGYNTRTEYNKKILKIGTDGAEINPAGGLVRYGLVKNNYILIKGSVAGPKKRLIRLSHAMRLPSKPHVLAPQIIEISRGSQQ